MSNPLSQASRYHEFAAECVRLADSAADLPVREGLCSLAVSYLKLAQDELARAEHAAERERTADR